MVKSIINAFDHMEFCFIINLIMDGNWAVTWPPIIATRYVYFSVIMGSNRAVTWPPIIATRYVCFATTLNVLATHRKS